MSRQRKFIITKDWFGKNTELRIGYPIYHRDLLSKEDDKNHIDCYGGGRWDIDFEKKEIVLYGRSDDFGAPNKKDIEEAIKNFDAHKWRQFEWTCERVYEDMPEETFEDMKDNFKFVINY